MGACGSSEAAAAPRARAVPQPLDAKDRGASGTSLSTTLEDGSQLVVAQGPMTPSCLRRGRRTPSMGSGDGSALGLSYAHRACCHRAQFDELVRWFLMARRLGMQPAHSFVVAEYFVVLPKVRFCDAYCIRYYERPEQEEKKPQSPSAVKARMTRPRGISVNVTVTVRRAPQKRAH